MKYIEIVVTYDKKEEAKKAIDYLVENKLISCAQMTKINSTYWWDNKIESKDEYQVVMKTKDALFDEINKYILSTHSYEVPEIIVREIVKANENYLNWINTSTRKIGW